MPSVTIRTMPSTRSVHPKLSSWPMGSNVYRTHSQLYLTKCVYQLTCSYLALTVCQGIHVSETEEFRKAFCCFSRSQQNLNRVNKTIKAYRGSSPDPRWTDCEPGHPIQHYLPFDCLMLDLRRVILRPLYGLRRHLQSAQTENNKSSRQPP
jgi:hypothetical protein